MNRPEPRLEFAQGLWQLGVRCAIDISDGLLSELEHICNASSVSASINLKSLALHAELQHLPLEQAIRMMAVGGDDYELCLSVPQASVSDVQKLAESMSLTLSEIGSFTEKKENTISDVSGLPINEWKSGYAHF